MINESIFENEAFDCFDEKTKKSIIELSNSIKGKSNEEKIATILAYANSLPSGVKFDEKQKKAILNVLMENMSEKEKAQISMIIKMVGF